MITSTSQSAPNSGRSFSRRARQSIRHSGLEVSDHRRLGSGGLRSPTKSPKSGTRLRPDHSRDTRLVPSRDGALTLRSFFELDLLKTVNFRAGVWQFGRPRGASDSAPPRGSPLMGAETLAPCATGARS